MNKPFADIKLGLFLVMLTLVFGLLMGVGFGVKEDNFKAYVSEGVAANPSVHDKKSTSKIWRYAQRAHFHAMGIAAFSIGLLLLLAFSSMKKSVKSKTAVLIGLGGVYPLAWLSMYIMAPSIGRGAAHSHIVTELFTYIGVGSLLLGIAILCSNLLLGLFED